MTEIPEHLLKRAQAAREKAAGEAAQPAAEADSPAEADSRIPAHLLERSKAAKAKAAGGDAGGAATGTAVATAPTAAAPAAAS
ncbi:MAG: menaquinol-cytochrome c reductase cytochrome b subunit, partial [Ilumatobacteraceae bacterium]